MRKIEEIKNEEALDVIADIIEPLSIIFNDPEFKKIRNQKIPQLKKVSWAIKTHKKEIIQILAILDGEDPNTYEISILALPSRIIEILNDKELISLFSSQSQSMELSSSGSATGATEEIEGN